MLVLVGKAFWIVHHWKLGVESRRMWISWACIGRRQCVFLHVECCKVGQLWGRQLLFVGPIKWPRYRLLAHVMYISATFSRSRLIHAWPWCLADVLVYLVTWFCISARPCCTSRLGEYWIQGCVWCFDRMLVAFVCYTVSSEREERNQSRSKVS